VKYFTKQLWIDAQQPGDAGRDVGRQYEEAFAAYARELESLRHRLTPEAFDFFRNADVHDGRLTHLRIRDFDPSAPRPAACDADGTACDVNGGDHRWEGPYRVAVELAVWTRAERGEIEWTLRYSGLRRILVDFPTESPLFFDPGGGFEDWGYHELSDAGDGFLRHEVLFSSGSVV
jgi:hypothetical protein